MAVDGHAPTDTRSGARKLYLLGKGLCPACKTDLEDIRCTRCGESYPIVGGNR
jgi:predicted amidophosphoribosyltransferase